MNRNIALVLSLAIVSTALLITSLTFVKYAEAHYNIKRKTNITERCYLIGYPSRTLCRTLKFTKTTYQVSGEDHVLILNDNNELVPKHKQGHDNHHQQYIPKRKSTIRLVYSNCGECN